MVKFYKTLWLKSLSLIIVIGGCLSYSAASAEPLGSFYGVGLSGLGQDYLLVQGQYASMQCFKLGCTTSGLVLGYLPFAKRVAIGGTLQRQSFLMLHSMWEPALLLSSTDTKIRGLHSVFGMGVGAFMALARVRYEFDDRKPRWEFGFGFRHYFIK